MTSSSAPKLRDKFKWLSDPQSGASNPLIALEPLQRDHFDKLGRQLDVLYHMTRKPNDSQLA